VKKYLNVPLLHTASFNRKLQLIFGLLRGNGIYAGAIAQADDSVVQGP
jgi:hypothetical protein